MFLGLIKRDIGRALKGLGQRFGLFIVLLGIVTVAFFTYCMKQEGFMDQEFGGVGRTWWAAIIVIVGATTMFGFDKIAVDVWKEMVIWSFSAGAVKSAIVGGASAITKKG